MNVTSILLSSSAGLFQTEFSFQDPQSNNPYQIRNIDGLDAENLIYKFRGAYNNGKVYDMYLEDREVTITAALNPDFASGDSFSNLIDHIYKSIAADVSGVIHIGFKEGEEIVALLTGFAKRITPNRFQKIPTIEIVIKPKDPMLRGFTPQVFTPEDGFPGVILADDQVSTAPHGFQMQAIFTDDSPHFQIQSTSGPSLSFRVIPDDGFNSGDLLFFSNETDNKTLYVVRDSGTYHLIDKIEPNSIWPYLYPGPNYYSMTAETTLVGLAYYHAFWGI